MVGPADIRDPLKTCLSLSGKYVTVCLGVNLHIHCFESGSCPSTEFVFIFKMPANRFNKSHNCHVRRNLLTFMWIRHLKRITCLICSEIDRLE